MTTPDDPIGPATDPAASTTQRAPSPTRVVLGGLLIIVGVGWLVETLNLFDFPWDAVLPAALIVVGGVLVFVSRTGTHGGLIAAGVLLTLVLAAASTFVGILDVPFRGGIGDRNYEPAGASEVADSYRLAIGNLELDLRATELPEGTTEIDASVVIGQLTVVVPPGAAVDVEARAAAGNVVLFGEEDGGLGVTARTSVPGSTGRRLVLRLQVGVGQVEVDR